MTSKVIYRGNLRTQATHLYSGQTIITDAPLDNNGLAEAFSPTDLVATALASCAITVMGIKALDMGVDMEGATAEITKTMGSGPRRIASVKVVINMPKNEYSSEQRKILEKTAYTCPVAQSLSADVEQKIEIVW